MSGPQLNAFFWKPRFRVPFFWIVALLVAATIHNGIAQFTFPDLIAAIGHAFHGDIDAISKKEVAFSLAAAISALAGGLLVSYGVAFTVLAWLSIRRATRKLQRAQSKDAFFADYDRLRAELETHPLLGHAFRKFDETLVHGVSPIANTIRPNAFFNYGLLKERLPGLKIMPSVPGYFVGVGLLLTFIGLVIALSKAAAGTEAASLGGGALVMQAALRELLHAATFKFATSIAGLCASIVLSFFFRLYTVGLETSLGAFCEALEAQLNYIPPQRLQREMAVSLAAQVDELKAINSEQFFAKLGQEVAPSLQSAMYEAMSPLTTGITDAVGQLSANSKSGLNELLERFSQSVQGSAGVELKELGASLNAMHGVMERLRNDMSGSGEDFARSMTSAAENLNRLVADAGANLGQQSDRSRETLEQMTASLKDVFEKANSKIEDNLTHAAEGASGRLEQAMDRVLGQLEGQIAGLKNSFGAFQEAATTYVAETGAKVAAAQEQGVQSISTASANAANALEAGLGHAMAEIRKEVEAFSSALRGSSVSVGEQSRAMDQIAARSREAADVFTRAAESVRGAVEPVARSNEKLSLAAQTMTEVMGRSANTLNEGQKSASALSQTIAGQLEKLNAVWTNYETRFNKVDEDLGEAFKKLAEETTKQQQLLEGQSAKIDKGLADAIDKLAPFVSGLSSGAEELVDAVEDLKKALGANPRQLTR